MIIIVFPLLYIAPDAPPFWLLLHPIAEIGYWPYQSLHAVLGNLTGGEIPYQPCKIPHQSLPFSPTSDFSRCIPKPDFCYYLFSTWLSDHRWPLITDQWTQLRISPQKHESQYVVKSLMQLGWASNVNPEQQRQLVNMNVLQDFVASGIILSDCVPWWRWPSLIYRSPRYRRVSTLALPCWRTSEMWGLSSLWNFVAILYRSWDNALFHMYFDITMSESDPHQCRRVGGSRKCGRM